MQNKKITNIKTLIENSHLSKILQKSTALNQLNERLTALFPTEFKGLFRVSNMENSTLILEVKSAMVRQALLFRQQELLNQIQQVKPELTELSFKINPSLAINKA
ncbi:uncharacterized protein DUF721 [Cricetibacter osteomyelitidis]|uniref:Uncharacterized protein DUF721 n=1 Tax=Cricetibacter osteomyelitidis TaxID=1521931 RepID=A0A4R2TLL4_9PAST|nr:DciA family protein [Cricetibacter osteomyelitidis]TCP95752.1 uncharacterized protein DUF721 [Cricetibacter osteomyelitidis]